MVSVRDTRIGRKFLYAGGQVTADSCFPKDVKALIKTAEQNGYEDACTQGCRGRERDIRRSILFNKAAAAHYGGMTQKDKTIGIWGLAFKAETDDMREATSALVTIDLLAESRMPGTCITTLLAMDECRRRIGDKVVSMLPDMYDATLECRRTDSHGD